LAEANCGAPFERFTQLLQRGAWPGCQQEALSAADGIASRIAGGVCGQCPMRATHQDPKATVTVIALTHAQRPYGFLGLSHRKGHLLQPVERVFLRTVARDLAAALYEMEMNVSPGAWRAQIQTLFHAMSQGVVYQDAEGRIIEANPAAERILGLSFAQMIGRDSLDPRWRAIREDGADFPGEAHYALVALRTGAPASGVMGVYHPAREGYVWIRVHATPEVRPGEDRPYRVCVLFEDITELRQAELAVREALTRNEAILETNRLARVGGWALEVGGALSWTETTKELHEVPPSYTPTLEAALSFYHPEDRLHLEAAVAEALNAAKPYDLELRLITAKGRERWVYTKGKAVVEAGRVKGLRGIFQDITERKAEAARRRALERQSSQTQRLESAERLAGGVAHDFNNLLTVINSYAELLLDALPEGEPLRGDVEEIAKAGARAAALTQRLLAFSRKQSSHVKCFDLNDLAREAAHMLARLLGDAVALSVRLAPSPCLVEMDPTQLEQVLMNLCVNARDAMPQGGRVEICVTALSLARIDDPEHLGVEPGEYALLSVRDEGEGMSAETQARIFEPFFTTKGKGKGSGFGLSTVYGIVRQQGGHIRVHSALGEGATFHVYLKRVAVEEASASVEIMPLQAQINATILVAEDEPAIRTLIGRVLSQAGYRVILASDGVEALDLYRPGEVQLLLTDILMPRMDGKTLSDQILLKSPDLKIAYMSGYTDDAFGPFSNLPKGIRIIHKPFSTKSLIEFIRKELNHPYS
ncbi:response regulator, partial [Myxococcota bacterium]|nr:response regulator [Myxococcota bacterium]